MANRRIDLNDIRLLMQVIEHGSYTAAARAINVPKSTISQRIAQLEAAMGTGLLRRTSRSFSLTDAGAQLLPHARAIEELARQVEQSIEERGDALQGTLRVSCSHAFSQFVMGPIIPKFLAEHDQIAIRVEATNRLVDLIGEGFDMSIRAHVGPLKDSTLMQRVVARTPWVLVAAPSWLATKGVPATPAEIGPNTTLCFVHTQDSQAWPLTRDGVVERIEVTPRLISDDLLAVREAALAGGGIACLPGYMVRSAFTSRDLVRVLPGWEAWSAMISVITPPKAQSSRLAAAFSKFVAAEIPKIVRFDSTDPGPSES